MPTSELVADSEQLVRAVADSCLLSQFDPSGSGRQAILVAAVLLIIICDLGWLLRLAVTAQEHTYTQLVESMTQVIRERGGELDGEGALSRLRMAFQENDVSLVGRVVVVRRRKFGNTLAFRVHAYHRNNRLTASETLCLNKVLSRQELSFTIDRILSQVDSQRVN